MKLIKNYRFWILLLFPFLCFIVVYFIVRKSTVDLCNTDEFTVTSFSDGNISGRSLSAITKINNTYQVNFKLREGYEFPYAGVQIFKADNSLFDLNDYIIQLDIDSKQDVRMSIRCNQFLPDYSDIKNSLSLLLYLKTFNFNKGHNSLELHSEEINEIPDWWFTLNPQKVGKIKSFSLKKTQYLWLYSEYSIPLESTVSFTIKKFKLIYNSKPLFDIFLIISLLYYIIILIVWKFRKQSINYILMPIEHLKIPEKYASIQTELLSYIATNYNNPQLKIADTSKAIGASESIISDILKQNFQTNFRQYLNKIRMEEAKHLLRESQLQIAEIAFAVGYNNIQHFNRVFKEYTGFSPKSYREQ